MRTKKFIAGVSVSVAFCAVVFAVSFSPAPANAQASIATCAGLGTGAAIGAGAASTGALAAPSGIPVKDEALIAVQTANLVATTKIAADSSTQSLVTCMLNGLAWQVAKTTIQSITRSTVNWINSGFQGSPAFITDLQTNLNVLSDTVANNFFLALNQQTVAATGFNLTSPFQDQITAKLRENYYKATGSLLGLNQYDLQEHSADPRAFINGDFSQGGFNAFFSAALNPANNPFGAYMLASNALSNQIDAAQKQRQNEYIAGNGFGSWRGNCTNGQSQQAANLNSAVSQTNYLLQASGQTPSLSQVDSSYGCPIKTPGSVIESQLENNLGSGIRQLELADSINEIVGALMGQLVNQVLGPNGLSGTSQPSAGGGASYINQATNASANNQSSSLTQGLIQTIANDLTTLTTYRDAWQKILDAANAAQTTCGVRDNITTVITQASAGVSRANTAIQSETSIQTSLQTAMTSTAADASTKLALAVNQYQSFLGASTTPSYADEAFATAQSTDTSNDSAATPSLYTQMVTTKSSCNRI